MNTLKVVPSCQPPFIESEHYNQSQDTIKPTNRYVHTVSGHWLQIEDPEMSDQTGCNPCVLYIKATPVFDMNGL